MLQRQLITVVIDSNAIWNDWALDRSAWGTLQLFVEHGLLRVCVPEVVVQEVARGYKRETNDLVVGLNTLKLWKLNKLLDLNVPSTIKEFKASVEPRIDAYERVLRARLGERQVTIVPVPQVDQQTLLTRALENRKPFDGEGKNGYRDALIWHTVLDVCRGTSGAAKVVFITENTSDFCVKKSGELLPELQAEIADVGSFTVVTVRGLAEAVDYLKETEQLDAELAPDGLPVADPPRELIIEAVTAACSTLSGQETRTAEPVDHWRPDPDFSGFSTIIEDEATLQDVQPDFSTLEWATNGRDSDGRPVVDVSVTAQLLLEGMAFKADYYGEDDLSIEVYDGDWNNHYMWVGTYHAGRLSFTIYLTPDSSAFDEAELLHAEELLPEPTDNPNGTGEDSQTVHEG
ncbi:PIN domain-containing protein [Amycolatopsis sp. cmx-4-54]|uniref:PIN domain-containing protein n=1 Tax=Amycolatopsis sp. cmx-4-54 TaxID=2790936 RepID=UPI00397AB463